MCLILVAWGEHPDFPLVVAANRDEFYARASRPAMFWPELPIVWGGLDLEAGGTWLGVTRTGRFAAVTNVREPGKPKGRLSRGALPRNFLYGNAGAGDYLQGIDGNDYSGFNLLVCDGRELCYFSNRAGEPRVLSPGIYGVSNHLLDTPWPKLTLAKDAFTRALPGLPEVSPLFALLADDEIVPDEALPNTGVPLEWERLLSAVFVRSENYGTRASTVILQRRDGELVCCEKLFGPSGITGRPVREAP